MLTSEDGVAAAVKAEAAAEVAQAEAETAVAKAETAAVVADATVEVAKVEAETQVALAEIAAETSKEVNTAEREGLAECRIMIQVIQEQLTAQATATALIQADLTKLLTPPPSLPSEPENVEVTPVSPEALEVEAELPAEPAVVVAKRRALRWI